MGLLGCGALTVCDAAFSARVQLPPRLHSIQRLLKVASFPLRERVCFPSVRSW
jgi:hypothetical protein